MGGCASATDTGNNFAPDMTQYVNLTPGQSFTHPGYCEYCTESNVNCGNNGEFVRDGNGDGKCKCRGLCNDGCCRKKCSRQNYSGTVDQCCINGGAAYYTDSTGIVRTCDPQYRTDKWGNKVCDQSLSTYCKQGNNLFEPVCRQWITTYQPTGNSSQATGNGTVDDVLLDVCNRPENASKSECGCIVAANVVRQKLPDANNVPVQCLVNSCSNNPSAYKVSNQMQSCNVVNCQISVEDLKIIESDHGTFNLTFAQNCGNNDNNGNNGNNNNNGNNDNNGIVTSIKQYWYIYLIILILILVSITLIVAY